MNKKATTLFYDNYEKPISSQSLYYGQKYLCFVGDECIGTATYIDDPYIGDSFTRLAVHKNRGLEEQILVPDRVLILHSDC